MLVTTRNAGLIRASGIVPFEVKALEMSEALEVLAKWANFDAKLPPKEAQEVIYECEGLPLAIAMVGAMVRDRPNRWKNVLHRLRNLDLTRIQQKFPDYRYPNLFRAIEVSVEDLEPPEIQSRYLDLAFFPEDLPIPEAALRVFWEVIGVNEYDTQDIVDVLTDKSLAQRDHQGHLRLNRLQQGYVRQRVGIFSTFSQRIEENLATSTSSERVLYVSKVLHHHLFESGQYEKIGKLVLKIGHWPLQT